MFQILPKHAARRPRRIIGRLCEERDVPAKDPRDSLFFDAFRLARAGLFRRQEAGEAPVALGSRALDLLFLLAERSGEIVSKDAIRQAVWSGRTIEDGNLTVQISALRRVIDCGRSQGSCIQTLPGRGYRFVAPVTKPRPETAGAVPTDGLIDKPSIMVLPFANLNGDAA